jgi:hypothetical protein
LENGRLWILQTRAAKRAPLVALCFALDFLREGRIAEAKTLRRLADVDLSALSTAHFPDAGAHAMLAGKRLAEGDWLSINGENGRRISWPTGDGRRTTRKRACGHKCLAGPGIRLSQPRLTTIL